MENIEREKRFVILGKTSNGGGGGGGEGTVTSVGISVPTGLNVIGSPVTSSGTIHINFANGYSIPTTAKQAEWDAKSDFSGDYNDLTNKPTLATVATSGDYDDLTNKPTIPSKTSDLTNDSGFVIGTSLSSVATSGDYDDLSNKPTIPSKTSDLTNDSGFVIGTSLSSVATSGSYNDLSDTPTIPTVGNGTITITQGGVTKGTFTTNQSGNATISLDAGGSGSGDVTAAGNNTFTGINSFMKDVFIGGFTGDEGGSISEENHSLTINSVNGSTYIGIDHLSMSNTIGNNFALALTEEFDDELQEYNRQTIIQTYNFNILSPDEGATPSVSINGNQVLTTNDVATVATSGSYNDLTNKPTIPSKTSDLTNDSGFINQLKTINNESLIGTGNITISGGTQVQSDWNETDSTSMSYILNKPTLSTVATTGDYDDLLDKPNIPTKTSDLTNDSGFLTSHQSIKTINNESLVGTGNITVSTFSGSYNDLTDKPTIPAAQVNSDWNASSGVSQILNKPSMSTETLTFIDDNNVSTTVVVYTQPTV